MLNFPESEDLNRLLFLYSESHAEETETIAFWKRMIQLYAIEKKTLLVDVEEFTQAFIVNGIFPTSFSLILQKLQGGGTLIDRNKLPECGDDQSTTDQNNEAEENNGNLITSLISSVWTIGQGWLSTATSSISNTTASTQAPLVNASILQEIERYLLEYAKSKEDSELVFSRLVLPGFSYQFHNFIKQALCADMLPNSTGSSSEGLQRNRQLLRILQSHSSSSQCDVTVITLDEEKVTLLLQWMLKQQTVKVKGDIVHVCVSQGSSTSSPLKSAKKKNPHPLSFYTSLMQIRISIYRNEERIKVLEKKMQEHKLKALQAKV